MPSQVSSISWSKNNSDYLEVKFEVVEKHDNRHFSLVQNVKMGEVYNNQFMRLTCPLVIAGITFGVEENLSPMPIPTICKDKDEQHKLAHRIVDVVDRANKKICVILLLYNVDICTSQRFHMFKSDCLQGRRRTRLFNQLYLWNKNSKKLSIYWLYGNLYLMKVITGKLICNVV